MPLVADVFGRHESYDLGRRGVTEMIPWIEPQHRQYPMEWSRSRGAGHMCNRFNHSAGPPARPGSRGAAKSTRMGARGRSGTVVFG